MGLLGILFGLTALGSRLARHCVGALNLLIELPPFLFGPAKLFHCGGEVEEVDRNDRCPWTQVGIPYQCIQFSACLYKAFVNPAQTFLLLGGIAGPGTQVETPLL